MNPVYIAVYGTLKKGKGNHHVMGDSEFVMDFKTEPIYTMVTTGGFPIVKRDGNTSITCEIYKVTDEKTLNRIYRLEGYSGVPGSNGNWYDIDKLVTPFPAMKPLIFVMNADKYNQLKTIESGIF